MSLSLPATMSSWLKRLSGAMCEPSRAAHGVALWMASLAESRASPTLSPASGSAPTMSASSDLVIRLRSDYSVGQKSARATSGNESLSSQWPTARAWDSEGGPDPAQAWRQGAGGPTLTTLAANWPTPDAAISNDSEDLETFLARQDRQKARGINGNGMGTPLAMAAKLWPTWRSAEAAPPMQASARIVRAAPSRSRRSRRRRRSARPKTGLAHRAIDGRWPIALGLHAVDAALMLVVVVALVVDRAGSIPSADRA
jgi:hypothetical protein